MMHVRCHVCRIWRTRGIGAQSRHPCALRRFAGGHCRCVAAAATAATRHANGDKVACHGARALGHLLAVSPDAVRGHATTVESAAVQQALQVLPVMRVLKRLLSWQGQGNSDMQPRTAAWRKALSLSAECYHRNKSSECMAPRCFCTMSNCHLC